MFAPGAEAVPAGGGVACLQLGSAKEGCCNWSECSQELQLGGKTGRGQVEAAQICHLSGGGWPNARVLWVPLGWGAVAYSVVGGGVREANVCRGLCVRVQAGSSRIEGTHSPDWCVQGHFEGRRALRFPAPGLGHKPGAQQPGTSGHPLTTQGACTSRVRYVQGCTLPLTPARPLDHTLAPNSQTQTQKFTTRAKRPRGGRPPWS